MMDYSRFPEHKVLCIDMKSFYASVEAVNRRLDPLTTLLAVVGDKDRPGSVVLAASPALKKKHNIKTGNRLFEIPKDPQIHIVNARMGLYLETSMAITRLFNEYVPVEAIHTYSVDESWIIIDSLEKRYGSVYNVAKHIQMNILQQLKLPSAVGCGPNKLISKLVLDNYAKKVGIAECRYEDFERLMWPLPIENIWGIGTKMKRNLNRLGISVLGDLAHYPLNILKRKFGVMGEQLYYHAWGIDLSPVFVDPQDEVRKGFSNGITLMRDYNKEEVTTVILETCDHIATKLRKINKAARTVSLSIGFSKNEELPGVNRSITLPEASNISKHLSQACLRILAEENISGMIRTVHISVSNLVSDEAIQLDLFTGPEDEKLLRLGKALDGIQSRYGKASVFRACSLTESGTAINRAQKIGGHTQ